MKILGNIAKWLFILCLPLLLLSASIAFLANSLWLYKYDFETNNISQVTGLAEPELEKAGSGIIDYFNSDDAYISLTVIKDGKPFVLFNEREIAHMKDVKRLIRLEYRILTATLIYVLAYAGALLFWRKDRRGLARAVFIGSSISLGLLAVMGIMSLVVDFQQAFYRFHLLVFTNDLWLLDPTRDYLLMLVPQPFWEFAVLLCGGIIAGLAVVLGGVSWGYLIFTRKRASLQQRLKASQDLA